MVALPLKGEQGSSEDSKCKQHYVPLILHTRFTTLVYVLFPSSRDVRSDLSEAAHAL